MFSRHLHLCVCVYLCLSVATCPHYCTDPDVTWGNGRGCPLVVHCCSDFQSVHGFRASGNIVPHGFAVCTHDSIAANAKCQQVHACTRCMPGCCLLS